MPTLTLNKRHPWALLSEQRKKEEYYYLHIQRERSIEEVAKALDTTVTILLEWAAVEEFPNYSDLIHSNNVGADRVSRDMIYMEIAETVAKRSTCLSDQNGAVIVVDNHIVATGYNGAPSGKQHCTDIGICKKEVFGFKHFDDSIPGQLGAASEVCRAIHAEQAAICQASKLGIAVKGGEIYVTREPCIICLRMIIACGIKKVFYPDEVLSLESKVIRALDPSKAMI